MPLEKSFIEKTMNSKFDCESSVCNPFLVKNNSIHIEVDPDINCFQDVPSFDTKFLLCTGLQI